MAELKTESAMKEQTNCRYGILKDGKLLFSTEATTPEKAMRTFRETMKNLWYSLDSRELKVLKLE